MLAAEMRSAAYFGLGELRDHAAIVVSSVLVLWRVRAKALA
jgi:hypothetical protein